MKFRILTLGSVRQDFVLEGEAEYVKRLKPYSKIEFKELDVERYAKLPRAERIKKESELLLINVKKSEFLVLMDESGKEFSSEAFAKELQKLMVSGTSSLTIAIGGAYGFDKTVHQSAKLVWSLSKLTFPFQLARLVMIEQLYRAMSIIKGNPYHK